MKKRGLPAELQNRRGDHGVDPKDSPERPDRGSDGAGPARSDQQPGAPEPTRPAGRRARPPAGRKDEVEVLLGRARYERTRAAAGSRNGQPRHVEPAKREITIAMPQVRSSLTRFVSSVTPDTRRIVRTRRLDAFVIGAYVRGLSDRDIESLAREAGLGQGSRTTTRTI